MRIFPRPAPRPPGYRPRNRLPAALLAGLLIATLAPSKQALAVPAYAVQTGQPCAACHVGAFGPQLKPFGRDFKLFGYTATDGKPHPPHLAATIYGSLTHTEADEPGNVAHFGPNDNLAIDQISLYYAGRITGSIGAFAQVTYDGVQRQFAWDNTDIRYAHDTTLFDEDLVWGVSANNAPTVTDIWNSTPVWGFPYNGSSIAGTPTATALVDGAMNQGVIGAGGYAMWNEWIYLDIDGYKGLGRGVRNALGVVPVTGSDSYDGVSPYWKLAATHDFNDGAESFEFGTYGLHADIWPGGITYAGTDSLTDTALDANFQWIANTKDVTSSTVSTHATWIHESLDLGASHALFATNRRDQLEEFRADLSYSYAATWTPTIQYFNTRGSSDPARWGTPSGSPNSSGVVMELAYVPWGKPDSPVNWANGRLALQYVSYDKFNGSSAHSSDFNTVYLNLWFAFGLGD